MDANPKPILFFIFFPLLCFVPSYSQSPPDEKQILLNLKNVWGSPSSLITWNPAGDHCKYAGISCSDEGYVAGISLYNSNISFPIPSFICNLKGLTILNLGYNYIPGEFPSFLYNCSSLQKLDISNNYFAGELPADIDRLPENLTHFIITGNNFTGDIPASIGRLPAIKVLDLFYNLFNGKIPAEIGNLSSLESLILAQNPFPPTTIPPEFGNLTSLKFMGMWMMNLVGEIPASIWMIKPLEILYMYKNNLTGEISKAVAAAGMAEIDLSKNKLTGSIPEAFGQLKNLSILFLYFNNLSGELPASIGRLSKLYDIRIFNNSIEGMLPPEMGKYSRLWNFEVDDNKFAGELPEHLCDGETLTNVIVFDNRLTGNLPESLGSCATLLNVQIQNNGFTGDFPAGIWSAVNLTLVMTQRNQLTGALPERLPWNLTRLEIQNNRFSGRIPLSAGGLLVFNADGNNFSGEIPASFFEKSLLQSLSLCGNRISGDIPATVGSMASLSVLDLSNNFLSGPIPETLGSLPLLNALDLSKNQLSGEIPSKLGDLKLNSLNLSGNALAGEIPAPLQIFKDSFFSNQNLCAAADHSLPNIKTCRNPSKSSDKLSAGLLILFIVLGALLVSGVMLIGFLMIRAHLRRKNAVPFPTDWKLTSFQVVDLSETAIFRGLTEENIVGKGGGGKVYRVSLPRGTVAVKKIWNARKLDSYLEKEFQAEVKILGSIRHANIVNLLCCISGNNSKLLVYEYLHNGSLDRWLHRRKRGGTPPLEWQTRLQIAVGAARGLCYMHHGCTPPVIHRDVKSSNILLDPQFNSKIADFGLARILVRGGEPETVSAVAGSFGYMAPECGALRKVNEKVDVYSFGVVLLELVTGREAGDGGVDEDGNLTDWAWRRYKENGWTVADAVDEEIAGESSEWLEEAEMVFRMGLICTGWDPASRPTMKEVMQVLMKLERGRVVDGVGGGGDGEVDLLQSKGKNSSRRKMIADVMDDSDDSGVGPYAGIDSLL